jgi:NADPH-dependent glutamate synthase beta subunit-like oxidoreductase
LALAYARFTARLAELTPRKQHPRPETSESRSSETQRLPSSAHNRARNGSAMDGFILTGDGAGADNLLETSVPGILAAGDVRSGSSKRCAAAVGEGSMAVQFVHEHLVRPASARVE